MSARRTAGGCESLRVSRKRVLQRRVLHLDELNTTQLQRWQRTIEVVEEDGRRHQMRLFTDGHGEPSAAAAPEDVADVLLSSLGSAMNWRNRDLEPWCLGTAQLGLDYGIANAHGQPNFEQARDIVAISWNAGIVLFDTAAAYGSSQQVLGKCFESPRIQDQPLLIMKLSDTDLLSDRCEQLIVESLKHCQVRRFFGLLSHSPGVLRDCEKANAVFESLKAKGLVEFCGVSVYKGRTRSSP